MMMDLNAIRTLVQADLTALDALILNQLESQVPLINRLSHHIFTAGGKRLRPLVVLLTSHALGYQGERHVQLAAVIEFIHTATLLHDDVVDASTLRRGHETANAIWGNEASVLVGDFLLSRAFQLMVEQNDMALMKVLADTTNHIAEGEVLQLMHRHDPQTSETIYKQVITAKTARLFQAAAQFPAILSQSDPATLKALGHFGLHLGTAFQLIDDAIDYCSTDAEMGKHAGDDLAEGKLTLPVIYALSQTSEKEADTIRRAIKTGDRDHLETIQHHIKTTGAIDYTLTIARQEIDTAMTALQTLPASHYRDALAALSDCVIHRKS